MTTRPLRSLTFVALLFFAAGAGVILAAPTWIESRVSAAVLTRFPGAEVAPGKLSFRYPPTAVLSGFSLKQQGNSLTIGRVELGLSGDLVADEVQVTLLNDLWLKGISLESSATPPIFRVRSVEIRQLTVDSKIRGLKLQADAAAVLDLKHRELRSIQIKSPSIEATVFKTGAVSVDYTERDAGHFSIETLQVNKLKVNHIEGLLSREDAGIKASGVGADVYGGRVSGEGMVWLSQPWSFAVKLAVDSAELADFTRDFELEEKMTANGKMAGKLKARGTIHGLDDFEASFTGDPNGGDLIIQDKKFLETIGKNTKQPLELVEAGLKEYHFDSAQIGMSKKDADIAMTVKLDGAKGKRNFEVHVHDVF